MGSGPSVPLGAVEIGDLFTLRIGGSDEDVDPFLDQLRVKKPVFSELNFVVVALSCVEAAFYRFSPFESGRWRLAYRRHGKDGK